MSSSKSRVVIAGQIPPPFGGQNIMIQKALAQFARSSSCNTVHLPFLFTTDSRRAREGSAGKLFELARVFVRLLRIRLGGRIDLFLYPTGGPQRVPMIRDVLLLPWVFLCSRRVVLHFHAAGAADQFRKHPGAVVHRVLRWLYGKAFGAVVMTEFNQRDPAAAGIARILVVPHRLDDEFDATLLRRADSETIHLLSVGHLCSDKGTPQLLAAFAAMRQRHPNLKLDLVGECLPPFSEEELGHLLDRLQVRPYVQAPGVLTGRAKNEAYGRADLFIFPSVAPYESFGLVLVEAMAWGLPIVASKWRGNREVLTSQAGAICFEISSMSLVRDIELALEQALSRRGEWAEWGKANRRIFEQRYCDNGKSQWLAEPILSLLREEKQH